MTFCICSVETCLLLLSEILFCLANIITGKKRAFSQMFGRLGFVTINPISALGLEGCIEQVWRDTIVYIDDDNPISIGRSYGKVSRHLLHQELVQR